MKILRVGKVALAVLLSLFLTEIGLRFFFGLGKPALVQADDQMGYRFQPNQKTRRFGNWIEYNQYSQRSEPIDRLKEADILRILMLGDSVLNGGNRTDQTRTITEQLETRLTKIKSETEVLNASANSWGIGNQWGYLQKFGFFNSDAVILQIGTHDLIQPTSQGKNLYPTKYPFSAIAELWHRYLFPRISSFLRGKIAFSQTNPEAQFRENLQDLQAIATFSREKNIPLFVVYTPDRRDILPIVNNPPYKDQFFQFLDQEKIPAIDIHHAWSQLPATTVKSYFVDGVHLTPAGQRSVAELVFTNLADRGIGNE